MFFYTLCNSLKICRVMALSDSLSRHETHSLLFVLCLDDQTYEVFSQNPHPSRQLVCLKELEKADPDLIKAEKNRPLSEYHLTLIPGFGLYVLNTNPQVDFLTYLEADTYFFGSPAPVLDSYKEASILLMPHWFPVRRQHHSVLGQYTRGWISFRRDEQGLACLSQWRKESLERGGRVEKAVTGNQKNFDLWPVTYSQLRVIHHWGMMAGPWNLEDAEVTLKDEHLFIKGDPLIFFHFHGLARITRCLYQLGLSLYGMSPTPLLIGKLYLPYLKEVSEIAYHLDHEKGESFFSPGFPLESPYHGKKKEIKDWIFPLLRTYQSFIRQDYCWVPYRTLSKK